MGKNRKVDFSGFKEAGRSIAAQSFARYLFFSIFTSLVDIVLFALLLYLIGLNYLASAAVGFIGGAVTGYILNKRYTFNNKYPDFHYQFTLYLVVQLSGLLLVLVLMKIFVEAFGIYAFIARILVAPILAVYNYSGHKFLTFRLLK